MRAPDFTSARWRKSTRSNGGGACVEVACVENTIGVRDSKLGQHSPVMAVDYRSWTSFLRQIERI